MGAGPAGGWVLGSLGGVPGSGAESLSVQNPAGPQAAGQPWACPEQETPKPAQWGALSQEGLGEASVTQPWGDTFGAVNSQCRQGTRDPSRVSAQAIGSLCPHGSPVYTHHLQRKAVKPLETPMLGRGVLGPGVSGSVSAFPTQ